MRVPRLLQRSTRNPPARGDAVDGSAASPAAGRAAQSQNGARRSGDSHVISTTTGIPRTAKGGSGRHLGVSNLNPGKQRGSLALAGFVALLGGFLSTAGIGGANGMVVAVGAGIGITGLVYAGFTLTRRRQASRIAGTAHVVTVTPPPPGSTHGRCDMHLIVQASHLTATAVRHRDHAVPAAKWPMPGSRLPVYFDPHNPRDLRILWERARPHGETVRRRAPRVEQLSEAPVGGPDHEELAALADAAGPDRGRPVDPARAGAGWDNSATATTDPVNSDFRMAEQRPTFDPDDSIDLSFLDPTISTPVTEKDSLLEEYGSPIREVGVTLIVSDLKQSLEFYRDVLGFFEIESGPDMVLLEARTGRLVLRQRDDTQAMPPRLMHLTLEVNDLDTAYRNLAKRGVEFIDEPRTVLHGELLELWAASFHDPDGHGVALTCWRPRNVERPDV